MKIKSEVNAMNAIQVHEFGRPEVLQIHEVER